MTKANRVEVVEAGLFLMGCLADLKVRAKVCGDIRRGVKSADDLRVMVQEDLGVMFDYIIAISDSFKRDLDIKDSNVADKVVMGFTLSGINCKVFRVEPQSWGAMSIHLTGNKLFNILLRSKAKSEGFKLSQYGLYHGDEIIAGVRESQIFDCLGVPFILPEQRNYEQGDVIPLKRR